MRLTRCFVMLFVLVVVRLPAEIDRAISFDIGAGLPIFIAAQGNVLVWKRVQVGFGYGLLPLTLPEVTLPTAEISLGTQGVTTSLGITPKIKLGFAIWNPYIRVFPWPRNSYLQLSYTMYRLSATITGTVSQPNIGEIPNASITGSLLLTQPLPTLSIGYIVATRLFYVNFALGATFFMKAFSSISLSTKLPAGIESTMIGSDFTNGAKAEIQKAIETAALQVTKQYFLLPSVVIAFGFFL